MADQKLTFLDHVHEFMTSNVYIVVGALVAVVVFLGFRKGGIFRKRGR